ncbi:flagellar hook-associated protein FlgL [Vibrio hippocampi]|uniref:Flagellin N-terminal domain-containing protein n=1 Tax=Vibrio hippocampi TaxID=654686 RepID=A0ABM8ZHI8_9VIBR|nr:flagellar hook-associated protein FlgL [Vibrio hippocampi]CAH0525157.1 hypothetical protein VHP8226_00824 [Vibrio hippocampi]
MLNRISSFHNYQSVQNDLRNQENKIHHNQAQLASGKQLQKPSDDPLATHYIQKVNQQTEMLDQYGDAIVLSRNRLEQSEVMLRETEQFTDQAKRITMQSINGALSMTDRHAHIKEMKEIARNFIAIANAQDESGNYTFAGTKSSTQPFLHNADGDITYQGDGYHRRMKISNSLEVPTSMPGDRLFMDITNPLGDYKADYKLQSGSELLLQKATNSSGNDNGSYRVTFVDMGNEKFGYQLERNGSVVDAGDYEPTQGVTYNGLTVELTGQVTAGDVVELKPQATYSIFEAFRDAEINLDKEVSDASATANLHQVTERFQQAFLHLTQARTEVGTQLNTLDVQEVQHEDFKISLARSKSTFEDLDYAKAVIEFEENSRALQASQLAFGKTKDLTLFNYL